MMKDDDDDDDEEAGPGMSGDFFRLRVVPRVQKTMNAPLRVGRFWVAVLVAMMRMMMFLCLGRFG